MGTTSPFALPFPELGDGPNVPRDVKALAEKVDDVLGDFVLPAPVAVGLVSEHKITARAGTAIVAGKRLSMKNTSTAMNLLVKVVQEGWLSLSGGTDNTVAAYVEPQTAGGTVAYASQGRAQATNPVGADKAPPVYQSLDGSRYVVLKPGETVNADPRVWTSTLPAGWNAIYRYGSLAILPVGWCAIPGTVYTEPDFTDAPIVDTP